MNVARGLKHHDLILSFLLLSKTDIGSKTFLRSLCKVLILCDFLNLGCLRIIATSWQPPEMPSLQPFDFLIECKLNDRTFQFCFSNDKILGFCQ